MKEISALKKPILFVILFILIPIIGHSYSSIYGQNKSNKNLKVALVYTVTTPELIEDTEREVKEALGNEVELMIYKAPSVFEEIKSTGYVTAVPAAKLIKIFMEAVEAGADAILSICSTVGDITYSMQDAAKYIGIPIIYINEEMCREAVRKGNTIAIMATFSTAIEPTKKTLERVSREMGKHIEIIDVLVEGGFGMNQERFKALMTAKAGEVSDHTDVIIFAQGSMAYCEEYIATMYNKVVLSNPRFGAKALKTALIDKGIISELPQ